MCWGPGLRREAGSRDTGPGPSEEEKIALSRYFEKKIANMFNIFFAEPGIIGGHQGGVRRGVIGGTRGGEGKNTFKLDKNKDVL